jgi:hypothetical protein
MNADQNSPAATNPAASSTNSLAVKKSSALLILLAWLFVSIPAAWGVYTTGKNALKLFHSGDAPAAASHN